MFQFFQSHKEEKIEINRLMDEAYAKGLPAYQREIGKLLDEAESAGKNDLAQEAEIAMGHYLERVAVSLDSALRKAENEEIKNRYAEAKAEPTLAGVEAKEKPAPLSAGDLFRILYYAYIGKKAGGQDAQRQDFLLGAYVDRALKQLERPI